MRRLLTGLLGAALLVSACGDDDAGDRAAVTSVPDRMTSTTTTTEPPVPPIDVIPRDPELITEEYVEQVLDALLRRSNDALLQTKLAGIVDESVIAVVEATTSEAQSVDSLNSLIELASTGFDGVVAEPTGLDASVEGVLNRSPECVFAEISLDASGVSASPSETPEGERNFAVLRPAAEAQLQSGLNPTAWVLDGLPATTDGSEPTSPCDVT